jgi:hypothetical protein
MRKSSLRFIGIAIALSCGSAHADDTDVPSVLTVYRLIASYCNLPMHPQFYAEETCVRRLFGEKAFADGEKIGTDRFNSMKLFGCANLKGSYATVHEQIEHRICTRQSP